MQLRQCWVGISMNKWDSGRTAMVLRSAQMLDPPLAMVTAVPKCTQCRRLAGARRAYISGTIAILKPISGNLGLAAGEDAAGLDIRRKAIM